MKLHAYVAISLLILLFQNRGLSQDNHLDKPVHDSKETKTLDHDLRKVTSESQQLDIEIDTHKLETDIDTAIENAVRSIDLRFEDMDVHPIEIDLSDLNLNWDHLENDFDYRDINIDRIEFDMEELDIDIDIDLDNWRK